MKKFILSMLLTVMMLGMTSCVSAQSVYTDYHKVYFDYVVSGIVRESGYVFDGYYSYHVISPIPSNVYWELTPCGSTIIVYNRSMVRSGYYQMPRRMIFYNHSYHHGYPYQKHHHGYPYQKHHHGYPYQKHHHGSPGYRPPNNRQHNYNPSRPPHNHNRGTGGGHNRNGGGHRGGGNNGHRR